MKFRIAHDLFRGASGVLLALPFALAANQGLAQVVTDDMLLDAQNTTPLIHNGVMYVTASHGRTFAVDARTGSMIWQYNPEDVGKNMCGT
jgi:outer membrane protein assembly factor BamB